ncbi:MAG: RNA polymerase sigma factor [Acidimicrobiales bacterium]
MLEARLLAKCWAVLAPDGVPPGRAGRATGSGATAGAAGPPDDLRALVEEHGTAIYRYALSIVRDPATAEDIAQEALTKAWLALPSFRGESSLRSWLLRITHNAAMSMLRVRRAEAMDPTDIEVPSAPDHVEGAVEDRLALDQFQRALGELDELSRQIVVLREVEDLPYDTIAAMLRVPLPTVKTRLLRARRQLVAALEGWR